jgi:predicted transcriptional regulator
MHKTTVYLNDEEVDALRRLAAATGRSQAELIRDAIRRVADELPRRRFRSLGLGQGPGGPTPCWQPAAVYDKVFGGR